MKGYFAKRNTEPKKILKEFKVSNIENSELKKFFFIHDVKTEMFKVCEEVFDLEIKPESNKTAWHKDVKLWSLWEKDGQQLAI